MQLDLLSWHPAPPANPSPVVAEMPLNHLRVVFDGPPAAPRETAEPAQVRSYWFENVARHPFFSGEREHLVVLLANAKLRVFGWHLVAVGTLNECLADPACILRPVIAGAAYGAMVMHNHPSGDTSPSEADRRLTLRLKQCFELFRLQLVDHVIVGRHATDPYFSFRESGSV